MRQLFAGTGCGRSRRCRPRRRKATQGRANIDDDAGAQAEVSENSVGEAANSRTLFLQPEA